MKSDEMTDETILESFVVFEEEYEKNCNSSKLIEVGLDLMNKVNTLCLFSNNEYAADLVTGSLILMRLPYYIGSLYFKKPYTKESRKDDIENAKIYICNFCNVCKDYDLTDKKQEEILIRLINHKKGNTNDISREDLIFLHKAKTELSSEIKAVESSLKNKRMLLKSDDEWVRSYAFKKLKCILLESIDLLRTINREYEILELKKDANVSQKVEKFDSNTNPIIKSFKMLRINKINDVFGLGYPSQPTKTIEEWAEDQIKSGCINTKKNENLNKNESSSDDSCDENAENLIKKREFDDFKDYNRRGRGNTYNRG